VAHQPSADPVGAYCQVHTQSTGVSSLATGSGHVPLLEAETIQNILTKQRVLTLIAMIPPMRSMGEDLTC
jgi:hypothetical protein